MCNIDHGKIYFLRQLYRSSTPEIPFAATSADYLSTIWIQLSSIQKGPPFFGDHKEGSTCRWHYNCSWIAKISYVIREGKPKFCIVMKLSPSRELECQDLFSWREKTALCERATIHFANALRQQSFGLSTPERSFPQRTEEVVKKLERDSGENDQPLTTPPRS